jgi:hypothetical protein
VIFPIVENGKLVVEKQRYPEMLRSNSAYGYPGVVIARDPKTDLALIRLERLPDNAIALKLARESAGPGERVHSVGSPGSSDALWVYTSGTVRQVYHKKWMGHEAKVLETQSPTNRGDSGGPLVNDRGELVGVTQGANLGGQLMSLFIDVSEVRALLAGKDLRYIVSDRRPGPTTDRGSTGNDTSTSVNRSTDDAVFLRLRQALNHMQAGRTADARRGFKDIVDKHPNSTYANEAKALLEALKRK